MSELTPPEESSKAIPDVPEILSPVAIQLYHHAANRNLLPVEDIPEIVTADDATANDALEALLALNLLRRLGRRNVAAVDPSESAAELLHAHQQRLSTDRRRLNVLQDQIHALESIHSSRGTWDLPPQERLTSLRVVRETLAQLAVTCEKEVLAAQPGGPRPTDVLTESADRDLDMLGRGVRLRSLYQHTARFDTSTMNHAGRLTEEGAEIRTVTGGLTRFLVFDRSTVVVPLSHNEEGALVLRDADVAAFAASLFELLWARGEPIDRCLDRPFVQDLGDQTKQAILSLLVQGADDRAVARTLGMSVRTCQRHVSELMSRVGARSRLELGYLVHKKKILHPVEAAP